MIAIRACCVLAVVLCARAAGADPLPRRCVQFMHALPDEAASWSQLLSLAACIQNGEVGDVRAAADLEPTVRAMQTGLETSLATDATAVQQGPHAIRVRAAYAIGMAAVAAMTRARRSIPDPPRLDAASAAALHAQLEPMLDDARDLARTAFAVVVREAEASPKLIADPVARDMVDHAREVLRELPDVAQTAPAQ